MRTNVWLVLAFIAAVTFALAAQGQEVVIAAKQLSAPGTVIEAESLAAKAKVSGGPVIVQNMQPFGVQWGGGEQLFWRSPAPVDKPIRNWPHLTTSLSAPADGEYSIVLYYTVAPDFGTFRVFLNGEPVKDVNGFAPAVGLRKLELAKTHLQAGSQQLVFTVFSKEPAATNYFVGLDRFEVRRVQVATETTASVQSALADALSTEAGIDRPGADYRSVDLPDADPASCRSACEQDRQCKAYTFVKAGVQGPTARCYLKSAVPDAVANPCCMSGVKPAALAPSSRVPQTERFRQARQGASQAASPVNTVSAGTKAEKPGPLGRGQAEGSINGKTALPACPTGGAPIAVLEVFDLLDNIASTFGASVSKSYYCGAYKREIATGVTLAPPQPPPGKTPTWGQLGGRGDLMADAMLCLMKDIGDLPGGKLTRSVTVPVAVGKVELEQTIGLSKFEATSRRAELYQVTRICAPLLGCLDAQRQNIVATVRESAPAWPAGYKLADYPIANSYSMELASDWGATTLKAKLPKIAFVTPYGQVSAQPSFSYATNLLPIDTPFAFKGSAAHLFHYPSGGKALPILQDTYGRSGTPFILNVVANLPQAPDLAPGTIWPPQPVGALKPQGWVSQIGLGGRDGAWDAQVWAPAAGEKYPERRDYDMTRARSAFERAPAASFVAEAPIRFEPPNPKSLLPGPVQDVISGVELWIEVTPAFTADYAAQLALLAREGVMVNACQPSSGEFGISCGLTETALVAQANAQGYVQITGKVHLLISFGLPFVDDIKIDEPFPIVGWPLGRQWDPSPAVDGVQRAHDIAAWAGNAAYSGPGDVKWQSARGFSGMAASDLRQWTEQCLKTPPTTVSTLPEPTHEPGKPDDLKPELLPCNICVTDKGQGKFAPFKLFEVTDSKPGVKSWKCWAGREGCYDLCSWDKATGKWQSVEKSAADIIGARCVQPQVK